MSVVITGGAGFIGSCLVKAFNETGITDIIIVDDVNESVKWKNLLGKQFAEYINKKDFLSCINSKDISLIIHMGACSSTTETDFDYLWQNNVEYSKRLFDYCVQKDIGFIYASSASTYGNGENGFNDETPIEHLRPLNRYGFSKQLFDLWVNRQERKPPQCVGLKFFNVYGPNEYHKTGMYSMVYKAYKQIEQTGAVSLFKSCNKGVADGEQKRDFVYVKDVCKVILWFVQRKTVSGLFNVGTGIANSFNDLVMCVFKSLGKQPQIDYVDMPIELAKQYQSFTQAKMDKLRSVGCDVEMRSLSDGVADYVANYLVKDSCY